MLGRSGRRTDRLAAGQLLQSDDGSGGLSTEENFIVLPGTSAHAQLQSKLRPALIVLGMDHHGKTFLWELGLPTPGSNARANQWHLTRMQCAKVAVDSWIRPQADMSAGGYNYEEPLASISVEIDWGPASFKDRILIAYKDRMISDADHPVVKDYVGG